MKQLILVFSGLFFSASVLFSAQLFDMKWVKNHFSQQINTNLVVNDKIQSESILKIALPNRIAYTNKGNVSQDCPINTKDTASYEVLNRTIQALTDGEKLIIRFTEAPKVGLAWLKGIEFSDGVIELDIKGRDIFQKSFIGVAFHGLDNQSYEAIYFRPFNFQSADPIRKIHAVQYISVPQYDFETLREYRKDEFESAILPSNIQAAEWFHVKIEVKNGRVKVFVNDSPKPCLDVLSLNPENKTGKIGLWVGNNSNGDFSNLCIRK